MSLLSPTELKRKRDRTNARNWRENNRDYHRRYIREYMRYYRQKNPKKVLAINKRWRDKNKEHVLKQKKSYYAANREAILAQKREYYRRKKAERNKDNCPVCGCNQTVERITENCQLWLVCSNCGRIRSKQNWF